MDSRDSSQRLGELPADVQSALLASLVETCEDAIIVHEPGGRVVYHNDRAARLLGLSSDEMIEMHPFGWVAPEAIKGAPDRLETILHRGHLEFRSCARHSNGNGIPTEVHARRVDLESGPLIVATIRDMSSAHGATEHLGQLGRTDFLTGLSSRTVFLERLNLAVADAKRHGDQLAVAHIDIDGFRMLNHRCGEQVADEVLFEVGRRIESQIREQDMVARLGSDEFVVLVSRMAKPDDVAVVAERLLAEICRPLAIDDHDCTVRATIGVALFDPETDDARSLMLKADHAMYEAKQHPCVCWLAHGRHLAQGEVD